MNRTAIEWVVNPDGANGFTWNPITGCKTGCEYCYARSFAEGRLAHLYPNGFEPTFWPGRVLEPVRRGEPSTIFVCSMGELFGPWVGSRWRELVFKAMAGAPQHTYLLLTKWPQFVGGVPTFAWVGASVDVKGAKWRLASLNHDCVGLCGLFASFEPLLEALRIKPYEIAHLDWIIIGAQTGRNAVKPERAWVQEIVDAAEEAGVPVFVKDNLLRHYPEFAGYRALPYLEAER